MDEETFQRALQRYPVVRDREHTNNSHLRTPDNVVRLPRPVKGIARRQNTLLGESSDVARLFVKPLKSEPLCIEIDLNRTVADLMRAIEDESGIPSSGQKLILKGKTLSDPTAPLSTFNFESASFKLNLMVKPGTQVRALAPKVNAPSSSTPNVTESTDAATSEAAPELWTVLMDTLKKHLQDDQAQLIFNEVRRSFSSI